MNVEESRLTVSNEVKDGSIQMHSLATEHQGYAAITVESPRYLSLAFPRPSKGQNNRHALTCSCCVFIFL